MLYVITSFLGLANHGPNIFIALAMLIVELTIYSGLKNKKNWIIPLVLFYAAFSFVFGLPKLLVPAENIGMIISKVLVVLFIFFCAYQVIFFSKRAVRNYFNTEGEVII